MFMGEYRHSIDTKSRLIIPARYREQLGELFVLTRGLDNCLFVFPMPEWQQLEQKLKALPLTRADARAFVRLLFSGASECELDRQGRILIPPQLRQYAVLERDVVIIGVSSRVEIWAQERWDNYNSHNETEYETLAEKLVDLNL